MSDLQRGVGGANYFELKINFILKNYQDEF